MGNGQEVGKQNHRFSRLRLTGQHERVLSPEGVEHLHSKEWEGCARRARRVSPRIATQQPRSQRERRSPACSPAANELRIAEFAAIALAATGRKASTKSAGQEDIRSQRRCSGEWAAREEFSRRRPQEEKRPRPAYRERRPGTTTTCRRQTERSRAVRQRAQSKHRGQCPFSRFAARVIPKLNSQAGRSSVLKCKW